MMDGEEDMDDLVGNLKSSSKKRKSFGRMKDVQKKLKLQSHETGEPCTCKNNCFDSVPDNGKKELISIMNSMQNNDEVNIYLAGLVSLVPIQRRRPRKNENEAGIRDCAVSYRVKFKREQGIVEEMTVCKQAFINLHGISRGKIEYLVSKLKKDATAPRDLRGTHDNRPRKLNDESIAAIKEHISSFKSRNSHYSLKKSERVYLDESLNIQKMFDLYEQRYPEFSISYESYRTVFNNFFNISFGYPRTDTCSTCDRFTAEKRALDMKLEASNIKQAERESILKEIAL